MICYAAVTLSTLLSPLVVSSVAYDVTAEDLSKKKRKGEMKRKERVKQMKSETHNSVNEIMQDNGIKINR